MASVYGFVKTADISTYVQADLDLSRHVKFHMCDGYVPISIHEVYCTIPPIGHVTLISQSEARLGDAVITLSANQKLGHSITVTSPSNQE